MSGNEFFEFDGAISVDELKREIERQYKRLYPLMPVDRFLCNPVLAIGFAAIVRDARKLDRMDYPDTAILETLINLRKRGAIKAGERES